MRRFYCIIAAVLLLFPSSWAQKVQNSHVIGFYNLENLFDTYHDEGKNDYEYLPDGANQWTDVKYAKKLHNMASVIRAMKDDNGVYHTILGVSEIENRHVLEDLVSQPEIADANFQIVHYDGPDRRGVDCGLLYRPDQFTLLESRSIPFTFDSSTITFSMDSLERDNFRTRDVLEVRGTIGDEMFAFYVAHLPSRIGGKSTDLRSRGAEIIYENAMKLMQEYPGIKIAVMGDMNDNPTDESMVTFLRGKERPEEVGKEDFFDPFLSMIKAGFGSLAYQGVWCIFDIIMVNEPLLNPAKGTFGIKPIVKKKFYGRVFQKPFMTQQEGQYKGQPKRTSSNGAFINGYSDHYPTYIVISNK
ncbi:MAG: endonuclease/exonuclease/phosphatase family protein [Bacteroidales bacterium]|nr:endonuclease/exonuclease/phosphatase family protein [Bacteroidales bacterium]